MNIIEAAKIVLNGGKVRRKAWITEKWPELCVEEGNNWEDKELESDDILATDWEIENEHN